MAAPRAPALRHLARHALRPRSVPASGARLYQSRVEPPVLDRYRAKLDRKIRSEGVASMDELRQVYADKISAVRKESRSPETDAIIHAAAAAAGQPQQPFNPPPSPSAPTSPPPPPTSPIAHAARALSTPLAGAKPLSAYIDVDKLAAHTDPREIELIWRARFVADRSSLCAAIPAGSYRRMEALARQHPMFVLPLPREGQGVEMHLLQWTFQPGAAASSTVIFTSLAEYKLKGEFAAPHTTLTHHLELAESKRLVLAHGTVAPDRGVGADEARWLTMALQKFYGAVGGKEAERRRTLLEMFSRGDEGFKLEALIDEVEQLL